MPEFVITIIIVIAGIDCDEKENFHRSCDSYDAGIYNGHNRVCRSITNK